MLANNIANQATVGYKSDREFYGLYTAAEALDGSAASEAVWPATLPVIERQWTDFTPGTLTPTDNPLDLALAGNGLFKVQGPKGDLYTRAGNFQLSADGTLRTQDGYAVLSQGNTTIQLNPALAVEVTLDGAVKQDGAVVAELAIASFERPDQLQKFAGTFFEPVSQDIVPVQAALTEVHQGKVESSNVAAAQSAVRLVSVMRQFEMLQKAVRIGSEMSRQAIQEVAKVTG